MPVLPATRLATQRPDQASRAGATSSGDGCRPFADQIVGRGAPELGCRGMTLAICRYKMGLEGPVRGEAGQAAALSQSAGRGFESLSRLQLLDPKRRRREKAK